MDSSINPCQWIAEHLKSGKFNPTPQKEGKVVLDETWQVPSSKSLLSQEFGIQNING